MHGRAFVPTPIAAAHQRARVRRINDALRDLGQAVGGTPIGPLALLPQSFTVMPPLGPLTHVSVPNRSTGHGSGTRRADVRPPRVADQIRERRHRRPGGDGARNYQRRKNRRARRSRTRVNMRTMCLSAVRALPTIGHAAPQNEYGEGPGLDPLAVGRFRVASPRGISGRAPAVLPFGSPAHRPVFPDR